jgi:quercetin dioxygenase-like cupin family protein
MDPQEAILEACERESVMGRQLDLSMMSFNIPEEIAAIRRHEQWSTNRRSAKTLVKNEDLRIVLVLVSSGMTIHEHQAEGPITVSVAQGSILFKAEGKERVLRSGDLLTLESGIPHQVEALEDSAFVLTVVRLDRCGTFQQQARRPVERNVPPSSK